MGNVILLYVGKICLLLTVQISIRVFIPVYDQYSYHKMSKSGDDVSAPAKVSSSKTEDLPSSQDSSDGQNSTPKAKPLDIQFQKRFSKNLLSNVIYFLLNIIIGLALVPFFLDTLGSAAYGLVPLATSLTSYVTLVIDAINGAISRYLTLDLHKGDQKKANETFNTALFGTLGIILILIPVSVLVACLAPVFFDIGGEKPVDVILLFALIFGSILVRTWSSNFMVTLFAYNRLDYRNYVNIANLVIQVALVIPLFFIFGASLPLVGTSYFAAAVISCILSMYLSGKTCSFLKIRFSSFSKSRLKEIITVSGWLIINKLGLLLHNQIALMFVNIMFGAVAGTEYSLATTWVGLLAGVISLLTNCFTPMVYSYKAKEDISSMRKFVSLAVKVSTLLTALLIGLVIIFGSEIMTVWVGSEYASLVPLIAVVIIPVIFSVQSQCCAPINAAYIKVQIPALANIFGGVVTLGLAFILPNISGLGIYGVALAVGISTFLISAFISPVYGAYLMKIPKTTFMKSAIPGYIMLVVLILFGLGFNAVMYVNSLIEVIIFGIIISCVFLFIISKLFLNKEEKVLVRSVLPSFVKKILPKWIL